MRWLRIQVAKQYHGKFVHHEIKKVQKKLWKFPHNYIYRAIIFVFYDDGFARNSNQGQES